MSDPMTNTEVEDVLASIRRLVSDDKRPEAGPVQNPPSDRLVLTPSLRVMEEDGGDSTAEDADAHATDDIDALAETVEAVERPLSEDMVDVDDHTAPAADAPDMDAMDEVLSGDIHDAFDIPDDAPIEVEDMSSTDESDTYFELSDVQPQTDTMGDEGADAENAQNTSEMHHALTEADAPDGMTDDTDDPHLPQDWADDDMDIATAVASDATEVEPQAPADHDTPAPATQSLSEKIAALETLVGKRSDQFEPDDPGADAYAGTEPPAMEWEDAEADADDAPPQAAAATPQPAHEETASSAQLFSSDEDVLDEDALRELVSDIVRQELQGALGERITRNVRKLVRREIHRALAAQDLE